MNTVLLAVTFATDKRWRFKLSTYNTFVIARSLHVLVLSRTKREPVE